MIQPNDIITLLTDFGEADGFVGVMKGVILSINPNAKIVDISHEVPAHDIEAAAFNLKNSYRYFPPGTVHVTVVDPGVGSQRRIIAVKSENYFFVAPDNQVLKYVFQSHETLTVVEVLNKQYFLDQISRTFHGRDIFAPIAAYLSRGISVEQFGNIIENYDRGEIETPIVGTAGITGKIIYIDKFGNLITNIAEELVSSKPITLIQAGLLVLHRLSNCYVEVDIGQPLAIIGSSGNLEIAVRNSNAQQRCSLHRGDIVQIKFE